MPYRPKVPCKQPGCAALVEPGKQYCEKHLPLHPEVTRSAGKRGYGSRWQRESKQFLQSHPLCAECMKQGLVFEACPSPGYRFLHHAKERNPIEM